MSSGNIQQEALHEELDTAIKDNAPKGKLEDAEIQRLVQLSNDASYQRSERVPVKTFEAFEPRSLVSIAMAAQQRREANFVQQGPLELQLTRWQPILLRLVPVLL